MAEKIEKVEKQPKVAPKVAMVVCQEGHMTPAHTADACPVCGLDIRDREVVEV
jgi:hypothetical protein